MAKNKIVNVQGIDVSWFSTHQADYISLTDMVKNHEGDKSVIGNWISTKATIEFLGIWERLNNPNFKLLEFQEFYNSAGVGRFVLSPQKWIEMTKAIGIISKSGRYGGTYAHKDIAFEFAAWLSPEFKLYLIKEFQRLKEDEQKRLASGWDVKRFIAKANYKIHTDAVKEHLIPPTVTKEKTHRIYANEADVINIALFGLTAKVWRENNPHKDGNIRDHASIEQLIVLNNLEILNAAMIKQGLKQSERLIQLNEEAIAEMKSISASAAVKKLKAKDNE